MPQRARRCQAVVLGELGRLLLWRRQVPHRLLGEAWELGSVRRLWVVAGHRLCAAGRDQLPVARA